MRTLVGMPSYVHLTIGWTAHICATVGSERWIAAYLGRSYDMSPGEIARTLGPTMGVAGLVGMLAGGFLGDRMLKRNANAYPMLMACASILATIGFVSLMFSYSAGVAMVWIFVTAAVAAACSAPAFASIQTLAPANMRATAAATVGLVAGTGGVALGPYLLGAMSDAFRSLGGADSLRWAYILPVVANAFAAIEFLLAARTFAADAQAAKARNGEDAMLVSP